MSAALHEWRNVGLARLAELEAVHAGLTGTRPGRRWGTDQLNRQLFVALVAQFQEYCRALHDEAVAVHVAEANPRQADLVRSRLTEARKLEFRTPRRDHLGSDFGRLGFSLVAGLRERGPATVRRLDRLDTLVAFRNAIVHGNEAQVSEIAASHRIGSSLAWYGRYRRFVDQLAGTIDVVVAERLAVVLQIPRPW